MNYAIVYSSNTGNTELLARHVQNLIHEEQLVYSGNPSSEAASADLIFVGFWTDKGGCDPSITSFLNSLRDKKVFLFGTAGFGGNVDYFTQILSRVQEALHESNTLVGQYMCQGKMPDSVRQRYESMRDQDPVKMEPLLTNFHKASSHPDENDIQGLETVVQNILYSMCF